VPLRWPANLSDRTVGGRGGDTTASVARPWHAALTLRPSVQAGYAETRE